ncbi:MAG TPA: hypothetical protein VFV35_05615, partial [Acidimicrobiales bacterium]|nr:hypothetical protein [Acidimicrobiales bacterium]
MKDTLLDERGRAGRREVGALGAVAADGDEVVELVLRFDALGDDGHTQGVAQLNDGDDDRQPRAADGQTLHERLVKLDEVEREHAQIRQRGIPG